MKQTNNSTYIWFENILPEGKKAPKWFRSWCVSEDGSDVFIPAAIVASETEVFLCAGYDGATIVVDNGHLYASVNWLSREYKNADIPYRKILAKSRRALREWKRMNEGQPEVRK